MTQATPSRLNKDQRQQEIRAERHRLPSLGDLCTRFGVGETTIRNDLSELGISLRDLGKSKGPQPAAPGGDTVEADVALAAARKVGSPSPAAEPSAEPAVNRAALLSTSLHLSQCASNLRATYSRYGEPGFEDDHLIDALAGAASSADSVYYLTTDLVTTLSSEPGASPYYEPIPTLNLVARNMRKQHRNLQDLSDQCGAPGFDSEGVGEAVYEFWHESAICVRHMKDLHKLMHQNGAGGKSRFAVPRDSDVGSLAAALPDLIEHGSWAFDEFVDATLRAEDGSRPEDGNDIGGTVTDVMVAARDTASQVDRLRTAVEAHSGDDSPVGHLLERASTEFGFAGQNMELAYTEFQSGNDITALTSNRSPAGLDRVGTACDHLQMGDALVLSAHELLLPDEVRYYDSL